MLIWGSGNITNLCPATKVLSNARATETLDDQQAAMNAQGLDHIVRLPSLPRLASLHSLPSFVPACLIEDALSSPDTAIIVSEGAARDERSTMTEQPALARQTEESTAAAEGALLHTGSQSNKASDQDLGMPAVPDRPLSKPTTALRCGAKRGRLAYGSSSDSGSNWEPEAPATCIQQALAGRQAKHTPPAIQDAKGAADSVLRNRKAQRQYQRRKKGKVAAVHARVLALEARLDELQADLTRLLDRHQALTEALPWARQLEEVQYVASIGTSKAGVQCNGSKRLTLQQRYQRDPIRLCRTLYRQISDRDYKDYAAETTQLPNAGALNPADMYDSELGKPEGLQLPVFEVLASLRLSKTQKKQLAVQGRENAAAFALQQGRCAGIVSALQALLTAPLESTHLSWRGSLLTHVLCGQLSGLDRHSADAAACSLSTCAQVLNESQAVKLAQLTGKYQDAVMALCAEVAGTGHGHKGLQSPGGVAAVKAFTMTDVACPLDAGGASKAMSAIEPYTDRQGAASEHLDWTSSMECLPG